jgi:hypothetical protein
MWHFADLQFADLIFCVIYGLKTTASLLAYTYIPLLASMKTLTNPKNRFSNLVQKE